MSKHDQGLHPGLHTENYANIVLSSTAQASAAGRPLTVNVTASLGSFRVTAWQHIMPSSVYILAKALLRAGHERKIRLNFAEASVKHALLAIHSRVV